MFVYYKIVDSADCKFDLEHVTKRTTNSDWSAIYLQTSISHALNYLEHKAYQTEYNYLLLVKFSTRLENIVIHDKIFGNPNISGNEKATLLKEQFNMSSDLLLMDNLNKPLLLLDNDAEYELIVPHHLLTNSNFQIEILKIYSIKTINKFGIQMKITEEIN